MGANLIESLQKIRDFRAAQGRRQGVQCCHQRACYQHPCYQCRMEVVLTPLEHNPFRASTHEKVHHLAIYRHSGVKWVNRLCICESRNVCLKLHDLKPYCTSRQQYIVLQPSGERAQGFTVAWFICQQGAVEHHHVSAVRDGLSSNCPRFTGLWQQ